MRGFRRISLTALLMSAGFAQTEETTPKFEVADIHPSTLTLRPLAAGPYIHGGRYEIRTATVTDLVRIAWDMEANKVTGGPSWVEFDRFDTVAKVPPGARAEDLKPMLKSLLADRFHLKVHSDNKAFPTYSLTATSNLKMKAADGSGDSTGCSMRFKGLPGMAGQAEMNLMAMTSSCHNATMASFADSLRGMMLNVQMFAGANNLTNVPVTDDTGLKGIWNFDLNITVSMNGGDGTTEATALDAIEKQLGLKLAPKSVPMPVIVVESADRMPTPNAPEVSKLLPTLPTEFDVAEIKPSAPGSAPSGPWLMTGGMVAARARGGPPPFQNDRVNLQGYTVRQLINLGWNLTRNDQIADPPKWIDLDRFDVIAKAPPGTGSAPGTAGGRSGPVDTDVFRPMIRALLQDKFKLAVHFEDRPTNAYVLTANKPKLQKTADPGSHTKWSNGPAPDGKDPRKANPALGRLVYCQNMTMAEFASLLPTIGSGYLTSSVQDSTGLGDRYDFTLNFSGVGVVNGMGGRIGGEGAAGPGAGPGAADPSGGLSLFDAISKQLGLKLETQKRPAPVMVIDHLETKPIDN